MANRWGDFASRMEAYEAFSALHPELKLARSTFYKLFYTALVKGFIREEDVKGKIRYKLTPYYVVWRNYGYSMSTAKRRPLGKMYKQFPDEEHGDWANKMSRKQYVPISCAFTLAKKKEKEKAALAQKEINRCKARTYYRQGSFQISKIYLKDIHRLDEMILKAELDKIRRQMVFKDRVNKNENNHTARTLRETCQKAAPGSFKGLAVDCTATVRCSLLYLADKMGYSTPTTVVRLLKNLTKKKELNAIKFPPKGSGWLWGCTVYCW